MEKPDKLIPEKTIGFKSKPVISKTTPENCILYALGIGFSEDPLKTKDLKYTYELDENFSSFPIFSTCIHQINIFDLINDCPGMPEFNPMMLLHGQQKTIQKIPLKTENFYYNIGTIHDVSDKGKGALVTLKLETFEIVDNNKNNLEEKNLKLSFINYMSLFIRGIGNFGYKGKYSTPAIENMKEVPKGNYKIFQQKTNPNQAILYRLSGDYNPLHIDPSMAKLGNFEKPILHGLCFYGIVSKLIVENFLDLKEENLNSISSTFIGHVFPGETLEYKFVKENNKIYFIGYTLERKKPILKGSCLIKELPKL